jgi:uncharacterized protein YjbI with pentapeptide repeats
MAKEKHLEILRQGVEIWNQWRVDNREIIPNLSGAQLLGAELRGVNFYGVILGEGNLREADLRGADLSEANLKGADLRGADLSGAKLREADLHEANLGGASINRANLNAAYLRGADLSEANLYDANLTGAELSETHLRLAHLNAANLFLARLREANLWRADLGGAFLSGADLYGADLIEANLRGVNLRDVDLRGANLRGADLSESKLVKTDFQEADLTGCRIYGISAWDLNLKGSTQLNLIITQDDQPTVTVDNLEVAQFIYLLLNNEKIRSVIDTITSKVVLILGRFTLERKAILDSIRKDLRKRGYLPVLFDFDKPASRDLTETVRTLAYLARFIIADITEPRSIPQELQSIVPDLAVPLQPILLKGSSGEYGMFESFKKYHWVLSIYEYTDPDELLSSLGENVIEPAEAKVIELRGE